MPKLSLYVFVGILLFPMPAGNLWADSQASSVSPFQSATNFVSRSPQRIVSINLCTDELLVRLTNEERIAALTYFSSKKQSSTISEITQNIPRIKGEIEEVLAHDPDLVVAGLFSKANTVRFLKKLGIPVVIFKVAEDFSDIYSNIRLMGEIVDNREKAEELIQEMQLRLREIGKIDPVSRLNVIFYQSGGNVPGANTFQSSVIELAGASNVAAQMGVKGHAHVDLETLLFQNIDGLIFLDIHHKRESIGRELLFHPAIKKALPNVQGLTMPSRLLNCGSPASVEVVELLASQLKE